MRQEKICETTIPREGRTAALDREIRSTRRKIARERRGEGRRRKYFSCRAGRVSSKEKHINILKTILAKDNYNNKVLKVNNT